MSAITEIRGNIFESSCQTLVNTVNCNGVMGKGIALEFKNRFPEMFSHYQKLCESGEICIGLLQLWKHTDPWILNFPTKQHWRNPSKLIYLQRGLKKFADFYLERGISSIAFPQLGCSQGGLNWERQVRPLMMDCLKPLKNLQVEIYEYDPKAEDSLFIRLHQKIHRFSLKDYQTFMNIPTNQAKTIKEGIQLGRINNMIELQALKGVGEKSLEKIYLFINQKGINHLKTDSEKQLSLF